MVDGLTITPEFVEENRNKIIQLRDMAIKQGSLEWGIDLTMTIEILNDYIHRIKHDGK